MILKNELTFPADFLPDIQGKRYKIKYLGKKLFDLEDRGGELHPRAEHLLPALLRDHLFSYDLRKPSDRTEWNALIIHLIMAESTDISMVDISDKLAKQIKELNSSSDMERLMDKVSDLDAILDDIYARMGVKVRAQSGAQRNTTKLSLEVVTHGTPTKS